MFNTSGLSSEIALNTFPDWYAARVSFLRSLLFFLHLGVVNTDLYAKKQDKSMIISV